jgi:hypothetical protein
MRYGKTVAFDGLYKPIYYEIPMSIGDKSALQKAHSVAFNTCLREYIRKRNKNADRQPDRAFEYGSQPFGSGTLSSFLTEHAKRVGIMKRGDKQRGVKGEKNGLINHNRKVTFFLALSIVSNLFFSGGICGHANRTKDCRKMTPPSSSPSSPAWKCTRLPSLTRPINAAMPFRAAAATTLFTRPTRPTPRGFTRRNAWQRRRRRPVALTQ